MEFLETICTAICHRTPSRTISWFGETMPLCARCTGLYAGLLLGLAFHAVLAHLSPGSRAPWRSVGLALAVLAGVGAEVALEGPLQWDPGNGLRCLTGLLAGSALSILICPVACSLLSAPSGRPSAPATPTEAPVFLFSLAIILGVFLTQPTRAAFLSLLAISLAGLAATFLYLTAAVLAGVLSLLSTRWPGVDRTSAHLAGKWCALHPWPRTEKQERRTQHADTRQ